MDHPEEIDRLQSLWLHQLHAEFSEICDGYRVPLQPPLIEIADTARELGSWCPRTRRLRLSRQLITTYPWSVTLQVLKHEMAHQLCSEHFHAQGGPHGPLFQRACKWLGVLPEFCRAGAILPETAAMIGGGPRAERGRRCIGRVRKLLALAESANEHEAALALQKANELLTRHHLGTIADVEEESFSCLTIDPQKKRLALYQKQICGILNRFFAVRCVIVDLFRPLSGDTSRVIQLFGNRTSVAVAEYCFHFLENRLTSLWHVRLAREVKAAGRKNRASFFLGVLAGFSDKLAGQRRQEAPVAAGGEDRALLVLAGEELDRFIGAYHPRLCRSRGRRSTVVGELYREGVAVGKDLSFAQGIDRSPSSAPAKIT